MACRIDAASSMNRRVPQSDAQMSLAGFDAPRPSDSLFFGVLPGPEAVARIDTLAHALRDSLGLHGQPRRRDHLHVTLHHLGPYAGVPPDVVAAACEAASGVLLRQFQARFDRASSFAGGMGKRPVVLLGDPAATGLHGLHAALAARLSLCGLGRGTERAFAPHVTLLYDARAVTEQVIPPVAWTVREFVLIHSLLGRGEYRALGRWPLRP
jgi:RNA 2',3'-cyclic 3'-phosphodiesterase